MYRSRIYNRLTKISVCFLAVMVFWAVSLRTSFAAQYSTVHGIVVDEEGVALSNVGVQIYTSGAAFVANTSTGSDGSFSIGVQFGTYTIHLTKLGYAKVVNVAVQSSDTDLGTIALSKVLNLSASTLSLTASPGDKIAIPFTVGNTGEGTEVVGFLVSKPEDWSVRVLYQSLEATEIYVSVGQSLMLQLEVTVPLAAQVNQDYTISLTAVGSTISSLNFTLKIQPSSETIIFCQFPGKSATPGDTVQYQVKLTNPFGVETRFKL